MVVASLKHLMLSLVLIKALECVVVVDVFSNFVMPCEIEGLPKELNTSHILWFQDWVPNHAVSHFLLSRGEIPLENVTPDAAGVYQCCYTGSPQHRCSREIRLVVKVPRPEIFLDVLHNTTVGIFPNSVYWLPEMLTTPLEADYPVDKPVELQCYFYVRTSRPQRPIVTWYLNDLYPDDRRLERRIQDFVEERHIVKTVETECPGVRANDSLSHCFRSTLILNPVRGLGSRRAVCTCDVWMPKRDGSVENRLTTDYRLGATRAVTSKWIYRLQDLKPFRRACDPAPAIGHSPLNLLVSRLNSCERNAFLRLWVSPATGQNSTVQTNCSRPFYVDLGEVVQLFKLPADSEVLKLFVLAEQDFPRSPFESLLEKHGNCLLESNATRVSFRGHRSRLHDAQLEGSVALGCDSKQVILACVYGPLFQLRLIETSCWSPAARMSDARLYSLIFVAVTCIFWLCFLFYHRRVNRRHHVVWKKVDTYYRTAQHLQRRAHGSLGSPPLPAPLLNQPVVEYVNLGTHRLLLEERIASGSYGDIYRGIIALTGERKKVGEQKVPPPTQIVAKVLNDAYSKDHVNEFANEVAILRLIGHHPSIIRFMGCANKTSLNNQPVLVMEYASGGTLLDYLRGLRSDFDRTLEDVARTYWWTRARILPLDLHSFAIDIANALVYLEDIAVVHGDVAARNVFLNSSLRAKLGDFGLACVVPHGEYAPIPAIKKIPLRWSAPEVLSECRRHARSDVWSFGVLLWEIWTLGETPFSSLDDLGTATGSVEEEEGDVDETNSYLEPRVLETETVCLGVRQWMTDRLPAPPLAPRGVCELMSACWATSVEARPDARRLFDTLVSVANGKEDIASMSGQSGYLPMDVDNQVTVA